ncbi:PIN domain-containing protein [Actinomycetospora corticicola]|uniref:PIN domain nuclease of toxin-antitoxin system n=1 Tax=Actinomycetospora corticicola TaxID=663602 RepID=A0A7Y9DUR0_9PSEU|nr:type II toxin-antitoxin system VapC family toxin [Actinomycetospora corticicola]NYD35786.1 PIN domain nuclease of toxin-antitoxin system [Actinomycetospora corticicola]
MTAVLDASAVLAWIRAERGADVVAPHLPTAVISAVNVSEVHQKLAQYGVDADRTISRLRTLGLAVEPVGLEDALVASRLGASTRSAGLSLGDRCCLALAARLGLPAVTADGSWTALDLGVDVVTIRGGT